MKPNYESFGRVSPGPAMALNPDEAETQLRNRTEHSQLLAFGNGRSYGDSCHNSDGMLVDMRSRRRVLAFDPSSGVLTAQAGLMLSEIINLSIGHGLFPAVVPGTRFVTLGGAIANDIHGKNHHVAGTFGCHVTELDLLRSDGRTYRCSRSENRELFAATIGGMGLTGLILNATIQLKRVGSPDVLEQRIPFRSIHQYLELAEQVDADNEYAVAWIDQLASGAALGQGILLAGNHADSSHGSPRSVAARLSVPFQPPFIVLNRPFLTAFNAAYSWSKRRRAGPSAVTWQSYFFPLDAVGNWNRLYGPRGLYQHQSVVPLETATQTLPRLLQATQAAGEASFLTVLKRFGTAKSPGLLSFPRPGYTLTLDLPNRGASTLRLLAELDSITVEAGGAVNPYKDARMSAETFAASFPNWRKLEAMRDPAFHSDFWRRTAGALSSGTAFATAAE